MALSAKRQKFVDAYAGNGVEACRAAGYRGNEHTLATQSHRLLRIAEIKDAIRAREKKEAKALILTRQQRQEFWSRVAGDDNEKMSDRLRAAELLGKSEADFTEKLEVRGELTLLELVNESMQKPAPPSVRPVLPKPEGT